MGQRTFSKGIQIEGRGGRYIYIDSDPWLIRKGCQSPMFVPEHLKGKRVEFLIKRNGEWDEDLIKNSFLAADSEEILKIPLENNNISDEIIWDIDPKGVFSGKGAYHLACQEETMKEASPSDPLVKKDRWRRLWRMKIIPRAKICIWKDHK